MNVVFLCKCHAVFPLWFYESNKPHDALLIKNCIVKKQYLTECLPVILEHSFMIFFLHISLLYILHQGNSWTSTIFCIILAGSRLIFIGFTVTIWHMPIIFFHIVAHTEYQTPKLCISVCSLHFKQFASSVNWLFSNIWCFTDGSFALYKFLM